MDIRKLLFAPHAITAFAMTVALTFPCLVEAVSIGEVVSQSKLGEPLLVQVDLMAESGEHVEDSCLSLAAPDPLEEYASDYLTKANLSLKTEGNRQYVAISSRAPFNNAFAILRLQVKCPGTGSVIKTLTILPDLDASVLQAPIAAPRTSAEAENTSSSDVHDIAPAAIQRDTRDAQPDVAKQVAKKTRPVNKRRPPSARIADKLESIASKPETAASKHEATTSNLEPGASKKQDRSASFRLKLSGEPINESRFGKTGTEGRELPSEPQKLLDTDDQMVKFLAMQNQVKQLQDELGAVKLQLAQLGINPATVASSATAPSSEPVPSAVLPATADTQENRPKPAIAVKQPVEKTDNSNPQNGLFAALGLALVILVLWLGLRYYTKTKSHIGITSQPDDAANPQVALMRTMSFLHPLVDDMDSFPKRVPSATPSSQAKSGHAPAIVVPPSQEVEGEVDEDDSILEEAELYAAHGRTEKAVQILQEIIKRRSAKTEAWSLLLSIYSSLGKAAEFEKTAREFLTHHKDSPSWSGIQALGRTLDRDNPLYVDSSLAE